MGSARGTGNVCFPARTITSYLWDDWAGLRAAHVFPLEYEGLWTQHDYGRWITSTGSVTGSLKITSVQMDY